jgi:FMN reductase
MSKLVVVTGGLREPSSTRLLADRIDAAVREQLTDQGVETTSEIIELRPIGRAIMDALLTGFAGSDLEAVFEAIDDADGMIAVSPAFNASYSGLFKSFFDVLPEETLSDMPVLIAATGGTERHSLVLEHAMRPMFSYLHAIVSPTGVYAATDDFGAHLSERIGQAARDFARLLRSCGPRQHRDVFTEEINAMESLLRDSAAEPGPGEPLD